MAQIIVRGQQDAVKARLEQRAELRGHSLEEEIRQILRHAASEPLRTPGRLGTTISRRFAAHGLDHDITEMHGAPGTSFIR